MSPKRFRYCRFHKLEALKKKLVSLLLSLFFQSINFNNNLFYSWSAQKITSLQHSICDLIAVTKKDIVVIPHISFIFIDSVSLQAGYVYILRRVLHFIKVSIQTVTEAGFHRSWEFLIGYFFIILAIYSLWEIQDSLIAQMPGVDNT